MTFQIGQQIIVTKKLEAEKTLDDHTNFLTKRRCMKSVEIPQTLCIFLGTSSRWDGNLSLNRGWNEPHPDPCWINTKCYPVYICQHVDKGGRYRKPFAVPIDAAREITPDDHELVNKAYNVKHHL